MMTQTAIVPWPLCNLDMDWWALDGSLTRHEVASELAHNLVDWWLDEYTYFDDDDQVHGWVTGYRALLDNLRRGFIRPESAEDDGDELHEDPWFHECTADHPAAIAAWIFDD